MASRFAREFERLYRRTREDIFAFCDALNFTPTWQQSELLKAVQLAQQGEASNWIACKSGQGPGKTTVTAIIALYRCWQAVGALTIVTAPTMRQCRDIWLVEVRRRLEAADPVIAKFFNCTKSKVEIGGQPDWGIKLVTAVREENAQGFHEENMTVICEEASGIPREIITQFKGTLSNPNALFIQIGNPNTRDCDFFGCFNMHRARWQTFTFNAEDTAKDYPHIVSPQRNHDLAEEFGRDSDVYRIRVLGEFPHTDPNCVLSAEVLDACTDRSLMLPCAQRARPGQVLPARQFGLDFARFGGDENTIYRRWGRPSWNGDDTPTLIRTTSSRMRFGCRPTPGGGTATRGLWRTPGAWVRASWPISTTQASKSWSFTTAESPRTRPTRTRSPRDGSTLRIARARGCYLPRDNRLIEQLSTRQYFTDNKGKLILEKKDDYMKRGHDSPDRADGLVLCYWDDVEAVANLAHTPQSDSVGLAFR